MNQIDDNVKDAAKEIIREIIEIKNKQDTIYKEYCDETEIITGRLMAVNQLLIALKKTILDIKNPYLSFFFAQIFENVDIKAHEQIVLKSTDPEFSYWFVENFYDIADVKAHKKLILESGNTTYINLFSSMMENIRDSINDKIKLLTI